MRKWIYGRDDDLPPVSDEFPPSPDSKALVSSYSNEESLDLMATKEIHKMPDSVFLNEELSSMKIAAPVIERLPQGASGEDILKEHMGGWKTCRKQHKDYMETREKKFEPSLKLLKTVYSITLQSTQ